MKEMGQRINSEKITKTINLIITGMKSGGNLASPGLAAAIKKAKENNMPNDTIDRAVKKATTDNSAAMENIAGDT